MQQAILNNKQTRYILLLIDQVSGLRLTVELHNSSRKFLKSSQVANRAQKPHIQRRERERHATGSGGGGDDDGGGRETRTPHSRS